MDSSWGSPDPSFHVQHDDVAAAVRLLASQLEAAACDVLSLPSGG